MERVQRRRTPASRALALHHGGGGRAAAESGPPLAGAAPGAGQDVDPASLVRGFEASLLRAGLAAYYAVIGGTLALVLPPLPGRHVDVRA